jgi:hypothetical protein
MGMFNTYWSKNDEHSVQLKVGRLSLKNYRPSQKVEIEDGVYVAPDGVVVVINGKLAGVFKGLKNKRGAELTLSYDLWDSEMFHMLFSDNEGRSGAKAIRSKSTQRK